MASLSSLTDTAVKEVRKRVEDPPRVSVLDVIGAITGHTPSVCSHTLHTLLQNYLEVGSKLCIFKFSGRGQRVTYVADAHGIAESVMSQPGRAAGRVRKQAASVMVRYLGGDLTMVAEIAQNRLSQEDLDEEHPARLFGQAVKQRRVTG